MDANKFMTEYQRMCVSYTGCRINYLEATEMKKLNRDKRTGDYYSNDRKYFIEKGTIGWNVSEMNEARSKEYGYDVYEYSFSCETLREVRESI